MQAKIISFRRSRHHQKMNQLILSIKDVDSLEKTKPFIGKKVIYKTQTNKEINGKVSSSHGNNGCIRAIFQRGIPGQALGKTVEVENATVKKR